MFFASSTYLVAEDGASIRIYVIRTGESAGPVSVTFATSNGTAIGGAHYAITNGTLNFAVGESIKYFDVAILDNAVLEGNKTFTVRLSGSTGAFLGRPSATVVTITDDEPPPPSLHFASSIYTVVDPAVSVRIYVSRIGIPTGAVSVNYATTNGTAIAGVDYVATNGTLNWTDGDAMDKYFDVMISYDNNFTGYLTFNASLSAPVGIALSSPASTTVGVEMGQGQATLPTSHSGPWQTGPLPAGWTQTGFGTDYAGDYDGAGGGSAKFDTTGDSMTINFIGAPDKVSYWIKGNGLSGPYVFKVEESADGTAWTDVMAYNGSGIPPDAADAAVQVTNVLQNSSRYVRFNYVAKALGNVGVDGVLITAFGASAFGVTVDKTNGYTFAEGSSSTIAATAANGTEPYLGYSWSSTLGAMYYTGIGNVFTILATAPTGSYSATITATDSSDPPQIATNSVNFTVIPRYAITITTPTNGTVTTTPATASVAGATVTIIPTPAAGYQVASISVVDSALSPVMVIGNTFTMPAKAVTVTVNFTVIPRYAITITTPTNGTVTTTPATEAMVGATVTVNSTPSAGYQVGGISVVDSALTPVTVTGNTFIMPAKAVTVTVNFTVIPKAITITTPIHGTVTTMPATEAAVGATVTINATPSAGYQVGGISVVDADLVPVPVTGNTFTMPDQAVIVTVVFELFVVPDIWIDFESNTTMGLSYAAGTSTVNSINFTHQNCARGNQAGDAKNGLYAGRFRHYAASNGYLRNTAAFTQQISKINFLYANFGANTTATFKVQVSSNGTGWVDVGSVYDPESTNLVGATISVIPAGMKYIQFITTGGIDGNRLNVDDIGIYFGKPMATVTLGNLAQTYDGVPKNATATTVPAGLTVDFTYNGSVTPPIAVGNYAVTGIVNDVNYQGMASGILVVSKAFPVVTTWPIASAITYGQALANSILSGGMATPMGSFAFTSPLTVPAVGITSHSVTYTPNDTTNYTTTVGSVSVMVNLAAVDIVTLIPKMSGLSIFGTTITTVPSNAEVLISVYGATNWNAQTKGFVFETLEEGTDYTVDGKTVTILPNAQVPLRFYRIGATPK